MFSPQSTGRHRSVGVSERGGYIEPKWRVRPDSLNGIRGNGQRSSHREISERNKGE